MSSENMITEQLVSRGIKNRSVLAAMSKVPRDRFISENLKSKAYCDGPLPIGHGQTISQPYIVALMTELVEPTPQKRALDIGTGSGYQAAILGELCKEVFSVEIIRPLADNAKTLLNSLGYKNIFVENRDGYEGCPEKAPFDIITLAAAPDHVPRALIDQLSPGGKLVLPVGRVSQDLLLIEKDKEGNEIFLEKITSVIFVPMTRDKKKITFTLNGKQNESR